MSLFTSIVTWWSHADSGVKTLPGPWLGKAKDTATPPYATMHDSGGRLHAYADRSFTKPVIVRFDIIAPETTVRTWQAALHTRFDDAAMGSGILECVRQDDYCRIMGKALDGTALYCATSVYRIVCENTF